MSDNLDSVDWSMLLIGLGYVAAVAVFCTWAIMSGRGDLAATLVGGIAVTAGVLTYLGTR